MTIYIAYAWKKAQAYIISTNWYVDSLEIKLSSIDFERTLSLVKNKVKDKRKKFDQLQLIPVPKGGKWLFKLNLNLVEWLPEKIEDQKLRPLAHISITDQTVMMLILMRLANKVESIQGNTNTSFENVHEKKIVSYGNRLYCHYDNDNAFYDYSSSITYSKFFVDYQRFLKRPQYFAQINVGKVSPDDKIYILELDIEKFFDNVDRKLLLDFIKNLVGNDSEVNINNVLYKFLNWDWKSGSLKEFKYLFDGSDAPRGIPQGLVSAGFLSNIYLIEFDKKMLEKIGEKNEVQFIDYCRYVDDIRIVVKVSGNTDKYTILTKVEKDLNEYLEKINLNINNNKSKIDRFVVAQGNISSKVNILKSKLSGPIPFEDIEDQIGNLETLLNLTRENDNNNIENQKNLLQQIDKNYFDIREDSLKRFAANKISKILSEIRHYTSQDVDFNGEVIPGEWDYMQERMSRRFIALWCKDPSITLLLKKGLELFPDKKILKPILDELKNLKNKESKVLNAIADYCISEIFRHSSTIIHNKDRMAFPAHADIQIFFELLQSFAADLIREKKTVTSGMRSVLCKQANYLLLVRLDTTLEFSSNDFISDVVFKLCNGFRKISYERRPEELALAILLANSIYKDESKFYRSLSEMFEAQYRETNNFKFLINFIANENEKLLKELYFYAKNLNYSFITCVDFDSIVDEYNFNILPLSGSLESIEGENSLLKLITRIDNPFANEIMVLKLFKVVIENEDIINGLPRDKYFDFAKTKIKFSDFSFIPKYSVFDKNNKLEIDLRFKTKTKNTNIIYTNISEEVATLHKVANFIRCIIIGQENWIYSNGFGVKRDPNYELNNFSINNCLNVWSKPEHMLGDRAQISSWLTDLLTNLLQINYYKQTNNIHGWPDQFSVSNLGEIIEERLGVLRKYYCKLSETPALIEKVDLGWSKEKKNLSVAMIQSKMPRAKDIKDYGLYLDDSLYRPQHRKHLTRVCKLILEHIKAQKVYEPLEKADLSHNHIDILVWPELAVHKDDLDVLINLSRKTKSIIFAGLSYIDQVGIEGPNNCAIWIVPNVHDTNQVEIKRLQGKKNMMALEKSIKSWRPYQLLFELVHPAFPDETGFIITGSICYDATDIALSSDLRDKSNAYFISALNKDINTFDTMVEALNYHMFQHVVLVNSGEFGGSFAKAPYKDHYARLISRVHGNDQVSISTFQMNMFDFRRDNVGSSMRSGKDLKSIPAGLMRSSMSNQ